MTRARRLALAVAVTAVGAARPAAARVPDSWSAVESPSTDVRDGATLAVTGPIKLRLRTISADVEISAASGREVTVRLTDSDGAHVTLQPEGGDRVQVLFDGKTSLRCGKACVRVPSRSDVDVATDAGDVLVRDVGGDVRLRTAAGDVQVIRAGNVEVRSISGDVHVEQASGEVRIETVSGDTMVQMSGQSPPRAHLSTTSGDIGFAGWCGAGCRLEARSLTGDVHLKLRGNSSFDAHYVSHTGEVSDDLSVVLVGTRPPNEVNLRGRYGKGEGLIECQTFSGDLMMAKQR